MLRDKVKWSCLYETQPIALKFPRSRFQTPSFLSHRSDDIESLNKVIIPHTEQDRGRTNPSEKIQSVDRSERKGEDIELTERVEAKNKASKNAENIRDLIEDAIVKEKARQREEWLEELTNVDELIYED